MKKRLLITIVMTLFMIILVPEEVSAVPSANAGIDEVTSFI